MTVLPTILRRAFVREGLVVADVVLAHAIDAVGHANLQRAAQVADERSDGNVHDIVTEATAVGPPAGNQSAVAKRVLNLALQNVASENAQPGKAGVVGIGR